MLRIVARQAPRGASTSTDSPSLWPSSAEPSGEVGETVPLPPTALTSTLSVSPCSSSSQSSRVTRPSSRKRSRSRCRVPSPTRTASPRQRPESSSSSERSSSSRGPRTAPRRSKGSRSAYGGPSGLPLPGSSMGPRLAPLTAALALRFLVAVGQRLDRLFDPLEHRLRRRLGRQVELRLPQDLAALDPVERDLAAACELRLALLPDGEQRRGDEDRR